MGKLFVFLIVGLILLHAPAWAQREAMKINDKLSVAVVKKNDSKEIKQDNAKPNPPKVGEILEIQTKKEVKK